MRISDWSSDVCSSDLPSGERVQLVVPPAVPAGTVSITIRKPSSVTLTMEDFERGGLFSETKIATRQVSPLDVELRDLLDARKHVEFFQKAVQGRKNILISGATDTGKTTLSKGLIQLIPPHERLLTIEDTRQLVDQHRNVHGKSTRLNSSNQCASRMLYSA